MTELRWKHSFDDLHATVSEHVLGDTAVVRDALVCLLAEGHLLIEGPPGVGKTVLARALAKTIAGSDARIQFTPDLLPGDITGSDVWDPSGGGLEFREGPVFHNVVLADEINRGSPKTQSALLEVMEERQVTPPGQSSSRNLPRPFFVIATQNPFDALGTYHLPEAQVDRFTMKITVDYPDAKAEHRMVQDDRRSVSYRLDVARPHDVRSMILEARRFHLAPPLIKYCVDVARTTRDTRSWPQVKAGVSPRATLALAATSRVLAASRGREHVTLDDVRDLVPSVFGHRMQLTPEARTSGSSTHDVLDEILRWMPAPDERG